MPEMDALDLLATLTSEPCSLPGCEGVLERDRYKDTDAVVCTVCGTPALRVWEP